MNSFKQELLASVSIYRDVRPGNLCSPKFRHTFLLLFWPLFGIAFGLVEQTDRNWIYVEWELVDGLIPFCELFVFPYMFWFGALVFIVGFTFLFDIPVFRKTMYFIILTYTVTLIVYIIWPTAQGLRPDISSLGRDNFLTRFMAGFYDYDTNTNVCPSIHVLGAMGVLFGAWHSKWMRTRAWRVFWLISCLLICLSTVFLKQHSIIDVLLAWLLCAIAYPLTFHYDRILRNRKATAQAKALELQYKN